MFNFGGQVSGSELGSDIEQRASTFFSGVQIVKTGTSHRQVNVFLSIGANKVYLHVGILYLDSQSELST